MDDDIRNTSTLGETMFNWVTALCEGRRGGGGGDDGLPMEGLDGRSWPMLQLRLAVEKALQTDAQEKRTQVKQ